MPGELTRLAITSYRSGNPTTFHHCLGSLLKSDQPDDPYTHAVFRLALLENGATRETDLQAFAADLREELSQILEFPIEAALRVVGVGLGDPRAARTLPINVIITLEAAFSAVLLSRTAMTEEHVVSLLNRTAQ